MATNGTATNPGVAPLIAAVATLQGNVDRAHKSQAHDYLDKFQKTPEAWSTTHTLLQSSDAPVEAKLFAATTLKGKIAYDIDQIPRTSLPSLRDSLLSLLTQYRSGPRPVRIQLCVCLASLALQMSEWKNVLELVLSSLGNDAESGTCVLEFLRVLPEEVTEGRRINLTEEHLRARTTELLEDNAAHVLQLLVQYAQSSVSAASNPLLFECITSWLREIPISDLIKSPLLDTVVSALSSESSFDAAVECMCTIFRETREVDAYLNDIEALHPRIVALRPKIAQAAESEDVETYKGITRLFAEAGEAWVVLIARMPQQFRSLVECVLECAARDWDRDAVALTFNFWYELELYLVLEKFIEARMTLADLYARLVDVMMKHLEYPTPEDGDEVDLFDGDRGQEEKFREFRHQMGDVLKDCCAVIGVTECLGKAFELIKRWVSQYGSQVTGTTVPHWQGLEAPLFSLRAMGRMVEQDENIILPQIMPLLVQVPTHEKVQFAAVMALGRYTDWTAAHPEFLEPQFNFIIAAFENPSKEVVRAAACALKFICTDCRKLLQGQIPQLQRFYDSVLDRLPSSSQDDITEGVAFVIAEQPPEKIYETLKLFCDPLITRLMSKANNARDDPGKLAVADHLQLFTIIVQIVKPSVQPSQPNPAVEYCQEIFPVLSTIIDSFVNFTPICERVCRCWRSMILSYRTAATPILPPLAQKLTEAFAASKNGCFLWATDAIVREFSEGAENVDEQTSSAIYQFFEQQATSVLRMLNDVPPDDLPDVLEDFFRLLLDALLFYPNKMIPSNLFAPIFQAALTALTLQQVAPLTATLHYIRDMLGYGGTNPPSSTGKANPVEIQQAVQKLLLSEGEPLVQRILTGMMFSFPKDCFPDASGVLLEMIAILPNQTPSWIARTIQMLPTGTVSQIEAERLMSQINGQVASLSTICTRIANAHKAVSPPTKPAVYGPFYKTSQTRTVAATLPHARVLDGSKPPASDLQASLVPFFSDRERQVSVNTNEHSVSFVSKQ
ncbi:MAG: Nuclear import receptor [Piccolia ochrophora]|nr:MAG: Nuclear import receptor [Piccolia ochrophora]